YGHGDHCSREVYTRDSPLPGLRGPCWLAAARACAYHGRNNCLQGESVRKILFTLAPVVGALIAFGCSQPAPRGAAPQGAPDGPKFAVDPYWPKPLMENRIFAQVAGLAVDSRDHVWVLHRPRSVLDDEKAKGSEPAARCCVILPAV